MNYHKCLICKYIQLDDQRPLSMLAGNHLNISFNCHNSGLIDAYGQLPLVNSMIFDLITDECWVDGGELVPPSGCINYCKNQLVNQEVENYIDLGLKK